MPIILAVGLLLWACSSAAAENGPEAPSVLKIPFALSLQGLFRETERIVPTQVGSWGRWERRHGVDTRYRAWRGPLAFRLSGDTLSLQAHVRYQVQVRKELLGALEVEAGCGIDEPPRQAIIGLQMRLAWNPDWTPRPLFRLLPPRFLDRCEMTAADIDITPLVGEELQEQMRRSLQRALADLAPVMGSMRGRAAEIWQRMNRPIPITDGGWLQLRPVAVALSPLYGHGDEARLYLALAMQPYLSLGERPGIQPIPLPPLQPFFPGSGDLHFQLGLDVEYGRLGQLITQSLAGRVIGVQDYSFGIDSIELSGEGKELGAKLRLTGQARGNAEIWVEPGFDPESKTLSLTGLDYVFEPVDNDLYAVAGMFYEKIRQTLLESANRLLDQEMASLRERLGTALAGIAPAGSDLDLGQIHATTLNIEFLPQGVRLEGSVEGSIRIRP